MIEKITLKNIAVYNQKTDFSNCKKINLIYGNNGTGKTVLSNYLMHPTAPEYSDCSIQWEGNRPFPIYVYNQKFCDENFRSAAIPGIFTLGYENVEILNQADKIENDLVQQRQEFALLQEKFDDLERRKTVQQNICIESLWNRVRVYKQLLGDYFSKPISKVQCFEKVRDTIRQGIDEVPGLMELKRKADVLNAQKEVQYPEYYHIPDAPLAAIESDPVWNDFVQQEVYTQSNQSAKAGNIAVWVQQGLPYIHESDKCPFCGQKLPESFHERLSHSSQNDSVQKMNLCGQLLSQYETIVQRVLSDAERILRENRDEGSAFLDTNQFADLLTNLRNLLHANMLFMQRKRDNFSQAVKIQSSDSVISALNRLIDESNAHAKQANTLLQNLRQSKADLKRDAWLSFCSESQADLKDYQSAIVGVEFEMNDLRAEIEQVDTSIRKLEADKEMVLRNSVNIRESVEKINGELAALGIDGFRLQQSETANQYSIVRTDGNAAGETLSEGERTMITLLYFLQLVEGAPSKEGVKSERIIVIDDPVSNLDDAALNAVLERIAALIRRILDGDRYIHQLFVMSHRKECTKKLRSCDKRLESPKNLALWILKKFNGVTQAQKFALDV